MAANVADAFLSQNAATDLHPAERTRAGWLCWVLPSFADQIFLVLFLLLVYSPLSASLLRDADLGWHIRSGEIILSTHAIPRSDSFSYTRGGQPWCAWEWLYDALLAAVHHAAGLNGVVLLTAAIISLTFALLFHFILGRSGNLAVAATLAVLAMAAAQVHMLARPHVCSWLFTLLCVEALYRFDAGDSSALFWLPPLILMWANLHAGFVLGLALLAVAVVACLLRRFFRNGQDEPRRRFQLAFVFTLCLLATLVTPYGYKLHAHIALYLSNSYLINNIAEFASPDFHEGVYRYFELLLLLSIAGVLVGGKRISLMGMLLLLFSVDAGLYSVRNIPVAAVIMCVVLGPVLTLGITPDRDERLRSSWSNSLLRIGQGISDSMVRLDGQMRGHALVLMVMAASVALALHGGALRSKQVLDAHFDQQVFPVKASQFIRQQGIPDHLFSSDAWSGYLIYTLYPATKVYFDDRHDFYGEAYVREYGEAVLGTRRWQEPLDHYQITWVLMPTDAALSSLLRQTEGWRIAYQDDVAVLFSRKTSAMGESRPSGR